METYIFTSFLLPSLPWKDILVIGVVAYLPTLNQWLIVNSQVEIYAEKLKLSLLRLTLKKLKKRKMASYINLLSTFTNSEFFLYNVTMMTDSFACTYDSFLIMANFNMEPSDPFLTSFCDSNSLINLIKDNCMF